MASSMPDRAFYLSEEDRDSLQDLISQWMDERINPANRAAHETPDYPATGCYVAYVPEGISALEVGTGTGAVLTAEPGSALCDVYRLLDFSGRPLLYPLGMNQQMVFNVSDVAISAGRWVLIIQDKFNDWYASAGGGAGTGEAIGDHMEKVVPLVAIGPPGSGTGSLIDDAFVWEGYTVLIQPAPPTLGEVDRVLGIYIVQRTLETPPESQRILQIGHLYTGHFIGIGDLGDGFRSVYAVMGAPDPEFVLQDVLEAITSISAVCNGGSPATLTINVDYTTTTVKVLA